MGQMLNYERHLKRTFGDEWFAYATRIGKLVWQQLQTGVHMTNKLTKYVSFCSQIRILYGRIGYFEVNLSSDCRLI